GPSRQRPFWSRCPLGLRLPVDSCRPVSGLLLPPMPLLLWLPACSCWRLPALPWSICCWRPLLLRLRSASEAVDDSLDDALRLMSLGLLLRPEACSICSD